MVRHSYDLLHNGEIVIAYPVLAGLRIPSERQVVGKFGHCYQRYNLRTLNKNTPIGVHDIVVTRERLVDMFKVQGQ